MNADTIIVVDCRLAFSVLALEGDVRHAFIFLNTPPINIKLKRRHKMFAITISLLLPCYQSTILRSYHSTMPPLLHHSTILPFLWWRGGAPLQCSKASGPLKATASPEVTSCGRSPLSSTTATQYDQGVPGESFPFGQRTCGGP